VLLRFEKIEERLADLRGCHHEIGGKFSQNATRKASWKFGGWLL
jgi:hypothetical protein